MATLSKREWSTGTAYRVTYLDHEGKRKHKQFKKKREAEEFRDSISHLVKTGQVLGGKSM